MTKTISIFQPTMLTNDKIRAAVDDVFDELKTKYTMTGHWKDDRLFIILGEGITGELRIFQDNVCLSLTLGWMLGVFSKAIEFQLRKTLEEKLG